MTAQPDPLALAGELERLLERSDDYLARKLPVDLLAAHIADFARNYRVVILAALRADQDVRAASMPDAGEVARMREALEWYGEQSRLCRLIHSEGDAGREALAADGGKRARTALSPKGDQHG